MRSWVIPAAIIVAIEYATALLIGFRVEFRFSIPFSAYLVTGLVIAAVTLCCLALLQIVRGGDDLPIRDVLGRYFETAAGIILVGLQMAVLGWLKIMLPIAQPFWADALLADLDYLVFGTDPWRLTHALLGWATPLIDRIYVTWAPVKLAALLALLCAPSSDLKSRCLLSYFAIVATGAIGQYLLSSAGPVFYPHLELGPRYAELPVPPLVEAARSYLWADYLRAGGNIASGISAFPSLHVAIALWAALAMRSYFPRLQIIGWVWFAFILVGSVHLGWHYVSDSLVACIAAILIWRLVPSVLLRKGAPAWVGAAASTDSPQKRPTAGLERRS